MSITTPTSNGSEINPRIELVPTASSPRINPRIELTPSSENRYSKTQVITINGKPHLIFISSKTTDGKAYYHALDKDHWDKLIPCVQRVFLTTAEQGSAKKHTYTNLTESHIHSVEIPLNSATDPIRYKKIYNDTSHTLTTSEMNALSKNHDVLRELRQTFISPKQVSNPYEATLDAKVIATKDSALAKYTQEYKDCHIHIHSLHTSVDKDISKHNFEFYTQALSKEGSCAALPITDAVTFDVNNIDMNQKTFIPLQLNKNTLCGIFIDPKWNTAFIYNPGMGKGEFSDNAKLKKILNELRKKQPNMSVRLYHASEKTQSYRLLTLFLKSALSVSEKKRLDVIRQDIEGIEKQLQKRSNELADIIQAQYSRIYEKLSVLGKL